MAGDPDKTLHMPVPEAGGTAFKVTDEAHTVWEGPALAGEG